MLGQVEELYKKKQIFEDLFSTIYFDVETSYRDSNGDYICFEACVTSVMDVIDETIVATLIDLQGEFEDDIFRFFRSAIPAQEIELDEEIVLFEEDAVDLLFTDTWNQDYPDLIRKKIYSLIRTIDVIDEQDRWTVLPLNVRGIYELVS